MTPTKIQEALCKAWIETQREYFLTRAYAYPNTFFRDFLAQCIESTYADAYETFLELPTAENYFSQHLSKLNGGAIRRLYQLSAIHHTICATRRRRKELQWDEIKTALFLVFNLSTEEMDMAEILKQTAFCYHSQFQTLFIKTTARFLFNDSELSPFSFAFIGNFWYNSYSSFMGSFTSYVPFHVRAKRVVGEYE